MAEVVAEAGVVVASEGEEVEVEEAVEAAVAEEADFSETSVPQNM